MPTVFLSPIGNGFNFLNGVGSLPNSGGKINTYLAGTTTPQATYTTSAGSVTNANPIVLNIAGTPVDSGNIVEIWLVQGLAYKFVLTDALSNTIATYDNLSGINDATAVTVPFIQAGAGAVTRTSQDKMRERISVKDFGAVGDGSTDDTIAVQAAASQATGKRLWFSNGTYLINTTAITIGSNTVIEGESHAAVLKTGTGIAIYTPGGDTPSGYWALRNADWIGGNSNIVITNMGFIAPIASNKGACHFRNVSNLLIENCRFDFGGPSATLCTNYAYRGNYCFDCINAGLDNWDGCSFGTIEGNHVLGNSHTTYGVLVTGVTTSAATSSPCHHMRIANNQIKNVTDLGIWVQGSKGAVRDSSVINNSIDTITAFHGLRVSDSERIIVADNTITATAQNGVTLQTEGIGGAVLGVTQDCVFDNNIVSSSNTSATAGVNAIENHAGKRNTYTANKVIGTTHKYAFSIIAGGDSNRISDNTFTAGATGSIIDAGTKTSGLDSLIAFAATDNSGTSYGAGPTDISWSGETFDISNSFISPSFTAKRAGKYRFSWTLTHTNGVTAADRWVVKLVATGITRSWTFTVAAAFNTYDSDVTIDMAATDTAKLTITRASGSGNFILLNDPQYNGFNGEFVQDNSL